MTSLRRAAAVLATLVVGLAGLSAPTEAAPAADPGHDLGPTSYSEPGPYGVGVRTLKLRNGVPVEVWYPARKADVAGKPIADYDLVEMMPPAIKPLVPDGAAVLYPTGGVRGVPVAQKKFPLVVFSHGFAGFRTQSSFLTSWLASWGFVVAAPEHPSRNLTQVLARFLGAPDVTDTDVRDLRQTITLMKERNRAKGSWLRGRVDLTRIGAVGHSAGGSAVGELTTVDPRVDAFVGMAGAYSGTEVTEQPGMLITGVDDAIIELGQMEAAYAAMNGPKRFVLLQDSGHLVFSDLCEVGASDGGLLAIGELLGVPIPEALVPLATDGCLEPAMPVTEAWPAARHTITAYLRNVLGIDESDAALTGLVEAYPGVVSDSRSAQ